MSAWSGSGAERLTKSVCNRAYAQRSKGALMMLGAAAAAQRGVESALVVPLFDLRTTWQ
jgi:hypothetical protein